MFFHIIRAILFFPIRLLFPIRVVGREKLPKGKVVITPNHKSNMDAVLLAVSFFKKQYYLGKKEWFANPIMAALLKSVGGIQVDRGKADLSTIRRGLKVLKSGGRLVIFPEGTRNISAGIELGEVKDGAAFFAVHARAPIVPVWFEKKPRLFRLTRLFIGEPYELSEFYDAKLTGEALSAAGGIIGGKLLELKGGPKNNGAL